MFKREIRADRPTAKAHPAEVMPAASALNVIASSGFFYAAVALRTVFCVSTDVISRLTVIRAFCHPLFDCFARRWGMVVGSAFNAEK